MKNIRITNIIIMETTHELSIKIFN